MVLIRTTGSPEPIERIMADVAHTFLLLENHLRATDDTNRLMMKKLSFLASLCVFVSCVFGTPNVPVPKTTASEADPEKTAPLVKPSVTVYLETSGSMNGYVDQGKSQFQQVVFDYLSNIQNSGYFSELNLNYITDKVTPKGNDVNVYVNSLTSKGLMKAAGSKATTDIAGIITEILANTGNDRLSIFISDCIFSPGSVSNPEAYLGNQKISIRNAVKSYIDRNQTAVCSVYQIMSDFNGTYYDYKNRPRRISMPRPFYVWVFGSAEQLMIIKAKIPDDKFIGASVANTWTIARGDVFAIAGVRSYGLLQPGPANGDYKWCSKTEVSKIKKSGPAFSFTFGADLSVPYLLYGEDYLTDIDNYVNLVDKIIVDESVRLSIRKNNIKASRYTHDLTVSSEKPFAKGSLSIGFDGRIPQWIYDCSDEDDSVLTESNSGKTYGLKYMCEGIYEGFHANNSNNSTFVYNFVIK